MNRTGLAALFCMCMAGSLAFALRAPEGARDPGLARAPVRAEARREPAAAQRAAALQLQGATVHWDERTGAPASIRGPALVPSGRAALKSGDFGKDALALLDGLSSVYRIRDAAAEFSVKRADADELGYHHVRVKQRFGGLRVVGAELIVHFDAQNAPYQVNGRYFPGLALETRPAISPEQASAAVAAELAAAGVAAAGADGAPELVVYALKGEPRLAYELRLKLAAPGRWIAWVDASSGAVLGGYNDLKTMGPRAKANVSITGAILENEGGTNATVTGSYDGAYLRYLLYNDVCLVVNVDTAGAYPDSGTYAYRYISDWDDSDRVEMSAARNFAWVQSYFLAAHKRNSFDGLGTRLWANVHDAATIDNAYWDDKKGMVFIGASSVTNMSDIGVLDVCAHEYTHALTQYTADLIYLDECGALNESFSDIFAAVIEFAFQPDGRHLYPFKLPGTADWLIGEDAMLHSTALRDMSSPASERTLNAFDRQPSRYRGTLWHTGSDDNGGVHRNSGVQNFFFYLLSDGAAGVNDGISYAVPGIGIDNAAAVAFRTLTRYCTEYTDYRLAFYAWSSAAQDLNTAWKSSVEKAWHACGISPEGGGDVWDPADNTAPGATAIQAVNSERIHGPHSLSGGDTRDWFAVYLYSGASYNFNSIGGAGDPIAELYDSALADNMVAYDDNSGGNQMFSLTYTPAGSGWYYLLVRPASVGGYALYTLQHRGLGLAPGTRAVVNDFTGDGVSDLAAVNETTAQWRVRKLSGSNIVEGVCSGKAGMFALSGDFDGDRTSEFVEYDILNGAWYVCTAEGIYYAFGAQWGGASMWPCPADYDGDRLCDFAVYDFFTGRWFISRLDGTVLAWNLSWGFPGAMPVTGDYNGDGAADLAVYDYSAGRWYIRTLAGTPLAWDMSWGYPAADICTVPGDYDGDGDDDLALFDGSAGKWYIRTIAGTVLAWGVDWGSAGLIAVPGDYNGDGKSDLALYYPGVGRWYIRSVDGHILAWDVELGDAGSFPVSMQ